MLLQFKERIIISNYALNSIIFNITLAVFSSSILSQLYPSSPTVSTFPRESAPHHLWFCASLLYFLFAYLFPFFVFYVVCSDFSCPSPWLGITFFLLPLSAPTMLGSGSVASIVLADTNLDLILFDHWGEEVVASDSGNKTMFNNCKFCRSPKLAPTWAHSLGGASQEIAHSHPSSLQ